MSMLEQPPPGAAQNLTESPHGLNQMPPPPRWTARWIWVSILLPFATVFCMLLIMLSDEATSSTFEIMLLLQGLVTLICWVTFSIAAAQRFVGASRAVLIVLYPVIEVCVQVVLFFGGCVALSGWWY